MATKKNQKEITKEIKGEMEMTTAEILATVDAGDYEIDEEEIIVTANDTEEIEEIDDELVDPPVETPKKTKKEIQKENWLKDTIKDENGNYYLMKDESYHGLAEHSNWNPTYYILKKEYKTIRIGSALVKELSEKNMVTFITREKIGELKKEYHEKLKLEKKKEKDNKTAGEEKK